jgi:predicted CXXCH cytochrome family protein
MKKSKRFLKGVVALSTVLLAIIFFKASSVTAGSNETIIAKLKKDIKRYHFKEDSFACEICHKNTQTNNFELIQGEADLCYDCHDRVDEGRWAHGPVGAGQCSVCHDPHGSERRNFLVRTGKGQCFFCHNQFRLTEHIEYVGSKSCLKCHDPHSGDTNLLLRESAKPEPSASD